MCLPIAVPSVMVTSTIISCGATADKTWLADIQFSRILTNYRLILFATGIKCVNVNSIRVFCFRVLHYIVNFKIIASDK